MLPTLCPFRGWKVLPLSCQGKPGWPPLLAAGVHFFSCGKSVVGCSFPENNALLIVNDKAQPRFRGLQPLLGAGQWPSVSERSPTPNNQVQRLTTFVQASFLDVVRHGRAHKARQRLPSCRGLANRCGRNRLVDFLEKMDGDSI